MFQNELCQSLSHQSQSVGLSIGSSQRPRITGGHQLIACGRTDAKMSVTNRTAERSGVLPMIYRRVNEDKLKLSM